MKYSTDLLQCISVGFHITTYVVENMLLSFRKQHSTFCFTLGTGIREELLVWDLNPRHDEEVVTVYQRY